MRTLNVVAFFYFICSFSLLLNSNVNYRVSSLFIKKTISRIYRIAMYEITNPKTKHMKRTWIRTKQNKKKQYVYLYTKIPPHKLLNKGTKYKIIKRKKMVKQRKEIATMGNQVWFAIVVGFFLLLFIVRSPSFVYSQKLSVLLYFFLFLVGYLFCFIVCGHKCNAKFVHFVVFRSITRRIHSQWIIVFNKNWFKIAFYH